MDTLDNTLYQVGRADRERFERLDADGYQPDVELLADGAAGRLTGNDRALFLQTLERSELALELATLSEAGALAAPVDGMVEVPSALLSKVLGLVGAPQDSVWKVSVRLLEQGLELLRHTGTLLSGQLAPVRAGESAGEPEHFTFEQPLGDTTAQLSVRREEARQLSLTLSLKPAGAVNAFRVELWERERLRTVRAPQAGTVIFSQVDPGDYRLVVVEKGVKKGEVELSLLSQ